MLPLILLVLFALSGTEAIHETHHDLVHAAKLWHNRLIGAAGAAAGVAGAAVAAAAAAAAASTQFAPPRINGEFSV